MKSDKQTIVIPITLIGLLVLSSCPVYAMNNNNNNKMYVNNKINVSGNYNIKNYNSIEEYTVDGLDRYETAVNISKQLYSSNNNVVLAKSVDAYGNETGLDAYTGSILAGTLDCPLLYTKTDNLNSFTKNEIQRLKVKNVYIVGGKTQISEDVEKEFKNMGINVKRIQGTERYQTSLDIAKEIRANKKIEEVIIVNGFNIEGINASVGVANSMNAPIIYVQENKILPELLSYIKANSLGVYVVGANNKSDGLGISSQVISQVRENARFVKVQNSSDALTINLWLNSNRNIDVDSSSVSIVEKNNMVDGTFMSLLSKKYNAIPLIIDKTKPISDEYKNILKDYKIKNIYRSHDSTEVGYESIYQYLYENLNKVEFDGPVLDGTGNDNMMVEPEPEIPDTPIEPELPGIPEVPMDPVEPEIPEVEVPQGLITITQADSSYKRIKGMTTAETKVAAYTVNKKGVEKLLGRAESDEEGYFNIKLKKKQAHNTEVIIYTFSEDGEKENRMIVTMKDMTAPEQPFVTNKIKTTITVVKGEAEAKTMIIVKDENNNIVGEGMCNVIGIFSVKILKQEKGAKLFVYSIDSAGNESEADEIVVKK